MHIPQADARVAQPARLHQMVLKLETADRERRVGAETTGRSRACCEPTRWRQAGAWTRPPASNCYKPTLIDIHRPPGPAPDWEKGARRRRRTPQGLPHVAECGGQARRGDTPARRACPGQRRGNTAEGGTPGCACGARDATARRDHEGAPPGPPLPCAGCAATQDAGTGPRGRPPRRCRPRRRGRGARLPRSRRVGSRRAGGAAMRGGGLVGGATPSGCPTDETCLRDVAPRRGGARAPGNPHGG